MKAAPEEGLRHRRSGWVALLVAGAGVVVSCGESPPGEQGVPVAPVPPHRPDDGLLERPELQRLVDLQVLRDGGALGVALDDDEPSVRARAAFALGSVQDPGQVPVLLRLLEDPGAEVRRDAAFALGQSGDPSSGPAILERLALETDADVRRFLLYALGRTGGHPELAALPELDLRAEEEALRALAVTRFGIRGLFESGSIRWLSDALGHEEARVRSSAAYFFGRIRNPRVWASQADRVRRALDSYSVDDPAAMHLLTGLARVGDPGDNARLVRWLQEGRDWRVRTQAAGALMARRLDDPVVREALLAALDDPVRHVALAAAASLTSNPNLPDQSLDRIQDWVGRHPTDWRVSSLLLIPLAVDDRTQIVREWLERYRDQPVARARILTALGAASGEDVTADLMEAVETETPAVASAALRTLGQRWRFFRSDTSMHGAYYRTFAGALRSGDLALQFEAASLLADSIFRSRGAVDVLIETYEQMAPPGDLEPMTAILGALGQLSDPSAEPLLREALGAEEPSLRAGAASALEALTGEAVEVPEVRGEPDRTVDWEALSRLGPAPLLTLETEKGKVVAQLATEEAPLTVQTIARFAQEGRYDGVPFHRVIPNFVAQTGDFARGDGFGGPGFDIRSEFTSIPYLRGVVGMASAGKDTEGSQFFVTHSMQRHLDGSYTAFGWVTEGIDVVDRILADDRILSASVEASTASGG